MIKDSIILIILLLINDLLSMIIWYLSITSYNIPITSSYKIAHSGQLLRGMHRLICFVVFYDSPHTHVKYKRREKVLIWLKEVWRLTEINILCNEKTLNNANKTKTTETKRLYEQRVSGKQIVFTKKG